MRVVYYPSKTSFKPIKKAVVTIGVFDGLHKGHILLLKTVLRYAKRIKGKSVVITLWPHPQKEKLIYPISQRLNFLERLGIDFCFVLKFNQILKNISAKKFIEEILLKITNPRYIIVGRNFRFGKNALGDIELLKKFSLRYRFTVKAISPLKINNKIISSTYLRSLLKKGKIEELNRYLHFPFRIFGRVIKGEGRAKILGFPTANLLVENEILPNFGVYIVKVRFLNRVYPAVCYIGTKPTFRKNNKKNVSIEVHIPNFKNSLYRKNLEVEFIKKLRPQRRFLGTLKLIERIKKDVEISQQFFPHH